MRRHILKSIVPAVLVIFGLVGGASTAAQQPEDSTLAGCLQPGAKEGEFVLVADDKQTYQVQPAAEGVDLAPHANHRVELVGTVEKSETDAVLKAKTLKMVAASCEG
jgi:hypothetical protein